MQIEIDPAVEKCTRYAVKKVREEIKEHGLLFGSITFKIEHGKITSSEVRKTERA